MRHQPHDDFVSSDFRETGQIVEGSDREVVQSGRGQIDVGEERLQQVGNDAVQQGGLLLIQTDQTGISIEF